MSDRQNSGWVRSVPFVGPAIANAVSPPPLVNVLRLSGVIGQVGPMRRAGLTMADVARPIERAFSTPKLAAVALLVNSPGGSPVQAAQIAQRIRDLATEKGVRVYAFCEDVAASGGYWLACAGDEIYADGSSVVGSVGVIYAGFGFQDLLSRIGVERRVHTAGERKSVLDPFRPEAPEDVALLRDMQKDVHEQFCAHVRTRRQGRLKESEEVLFSGAFWTGRRALELGLVDGLGDVRSVLRGKFGDKVRLRAVGGRRGWLFRRIAPGGRRDDRYSEGYSAGAATAGAAMVEAAISVLEERALWARYGL